MRPETGGSGSGFSLQFSRDAEQSLLYLIDGTLRNQGTDMERGDGYAAAPGSSHADFETTTGATYLSIFKI